MTSSRWYAKGQRHLLTFPWARCALPQASQQHDGKYNAYVTRHEMDAHNLSYNFIVNLLASPQSGKEDRQAARLNFNCCVRVGGGDAAWLRHLSIVMSHWVISSELLHGAHSW